MGELVSRYEQVIAELQQSNNELRSSLSRINAQVDQIRAVQNNTADSVTALSNRVQSNHDPEAPARSNNSLLESGPIMWVLLVVGIVALLLSIGLFVFKSRMRRDRALASTYEDDTGDYMDEDDIEMSRLLAEAASAASADGGKEKASESKTSAAPESKSAPKQALADSGAIHDDDMPISHEENMGHAVSDDNFDAGFDNNLGDFADSGNSGVKGGGVHAPDFHDEIVMPPSPGSVAEPPAAPMQTATIKSAEDQQSENRQDHLWMSQTSAEPISDKVI